VVSMSEGYLSPRREIRGRVRGTHAGQAMRHTTRHATVYFRLTRLSKNPNVWFFHRIRSLKINEIKVHNLGNSEFFNSLNHRLHLTPGSAVLLSHASHCSAPRCR
jgi:hypothetical protein